MADLTRRVVDQPPRPHQLAGVAAVSAGILMLELGLTRLLSVTTWYHFAFFAISLALLGLGASGVFVYVAQRRLAAIPAGRLFVWSGMGFAALSVLLMVLYLNTSLGVAAMSGGVARLLLAHLVGAAPFFAGGIYLTLAISSYATHVTKVYAADLLGAAAGCLLFIPALGLFGGPGPMLGAAALGAAGALAFGSTTVTRRGIVAALTLVVGMLAAQAARPVFDVQFAKGEAMRPHLFSEWNSYSRVAVYPDPHPDWGLTATVAVELVPSLTMDIDASASTAILVPAADDDVEYLRYDITSLGYYLLPPDASTLIIGPGGGRDLWTSIVFGAAQTTGVEINSIIVEVMGDEFFAESAGIYARPGVSVVVDDGRNYIARSDAAYDLIQASLVDTWAASSAGAFALSESNLYTVEAFVEYLEHLTPDGVLTVSRWRPGSLRLVSLARAAAESMGWASVADRLYVAASPDRGGGPGLATVIVKRSPLTPAEIDRLIATSAELGFEVLYAPGGGGGAPQGRSDFVTLATAADLRPLLEESPVDLSAVTDDRPFFFQSFKAQDLGGVAAGLVAGTDTGAVGLVAQLLALSVLLVALLILFPLRFLSPERAPRSQFPLWRLGYFGCLGVGFIVMEVGLIQRFVLFLGHPTYALTVVLFTFLLGAGLGSALSRWLGSPYRLAVIALALVVALGLVYAVVLPEVLAAGLGLARWLRIAAAVALLLPLSLLMGVPLPAGVRLLANRSPGMVAWAWGINGATSVVGSALAILLAISLGFTAVTAFAAGLYGAALVVHVVTPRLEAARAR